VIVFPEGTTTNGNVLLGCIPVIPSDTKTPKANFHILSFKYVLVLVLYFDLRRYPYTDFSPVYTVGSFVMHVVKLCAQVSTKMY
jgi:hypothetical protein